MKTTIFLFHPNIAKSTANAALIKDANVEVRDIYRLYPDGKIDVKAEQEALLRTDRVVLQFPMYWFSSPALFKKWEDLVYEHGWAYGSKGHALENKEVLLAVTAGAKAAEYQASGKWHHTFNEYLLPIIATSEGVGMKVLKPFIVGGAFYLDSAELGEYAQRYHQILVDPDYGKKEGE